MTEQTGKSPREAGLLQRKAGMFDFLRVGTQWATRQHFLGTSLPVAHPRRRGLGARCACLVAQVTDLIMIALRGLRL